MTDQTVEEVLAQRGNRYGPFSGHASITMQLKEIIYNALDANLTYQALPVDDRYVIDEALSMIAHKIGRVCNGDPTYDDNWVDIAGYAKLVNSNLGGNQL